jgi:hypothetical protein
MHGAAKREQRSSQVDESDKRKNSLARKGAPMRLQQEQKSCQYCDIYKPFKETHALAVKRLLPGPLMSPARLGCSVMISAMV